MKKTKGFTMPHQISIIDPERMMRMWKKNRWMRPERVMALGFLALILLGGVLLSLPCAAQNGRSIGLGNGLFTATSAVCVTGLVAVDTGTTFSLFGQLTLLLLIQIGGLGFMAFATLTMVLLGRKIGLRDRMLLRESMNTSGLSGLVRLTRWYLTAALVIEGGGAVLLAIRFVPLLGWGKGVYFSIFHAVSAFCNAGFDLFGHFSISALIVLGGTGFAVLGEVTRQRFQWRELSLHSRLVLGMTGVLLLMGMTFFCLTEWRNPATLGGISGAENKLVNALMQSTTMRTAGFNSVDLASMRQSSKLMSIILMFIGASPASTGGGVKTTTVAVLALTVWSVIRGDADVQLARRRVPPGLIRRALAIVSISLAMALGGTMLLTLLEGDGQPFLDMMFEAFSAMATVGVSSAGTPNLSAGSKTVLALMMFFGRVGPLTMASALASRQNRNASKIRYPEEEITIG